MSEPQLPTTMQINLFNIEGKKQITKDIDNKISLYKAQAKQNTEVFV